MGKTAALFLVSEFEEIEAVGTIDVLRRGGVEVVVVSLTGGLTVTGSHGISIQADVFFSDAKAKAYDAIILPGGPGTRFYGEHEDFIKYLKDIQTNTEILMAAICAAPSVLGRLGAYQGRRAVCYPGYEKYLTGAHVTQNAAETDGRFITGRGPGCVFEFAFEVLKWLNGDEVNKNIRAVMLYS